MASRKSESEGPRTLSQAIEHRLGFSLNWTAEQFEESQSTGWSYFGPCVIIACPGCEIHELHVWKNQASEWGWRLICAGCEGRFKYGHLKTDGNRFLGWASREPIPRIPVSCSSDFFDVDLVRNNIREGRPISFSHRANALNLEGDVDLDVLVGRGVTRLCHFTPEWRLDSILEYGLLPGDNPKVCGANDKDKSEGREDTVRLTIEYPNLFLLDFWKARLGINDWVVILLDPVVVAGGQTEYSQVNAASWRGDRIMQGKAGIDSMYAETVTPRRNRPDTRIGFDDFLPNCPTHLQAEVLVQEKIDVKHFLGIVTKDEIVRRRVEQLVENHCG